MVDEGTEPTVLSSDSTPERPVVTEYKVNLPDDKECATGCREVTWWLAAAGKNGIETGIQVNMINGLTCGNCISTMNRMRDWLRRLTTFCLRK